MATIEKDITLRFNHKICEQLRLRGYTEISDICNKISQYAWRKEMPNFRIEVWPDLEKGHVVVKFSSSIPELLLNYQGLRDEVMAVEKLLNKEED